MLTVIAGIGGGLALFLFGLQVTSDSLQKAAGGMLRGILRLVTKNPVKGIMTGLFITFCTQSSSATTVLLIGFVRTGMMRFYQTIGVLLGADLGTTITVQLIAFRIEDYALIIVAAGFIISAACRYEREKLAGRALFGFGLIFTGMMMMGQGVEPLEDSGGFLRALVLLKESPLLSLAAAALITAVIQGSAATIAFAITLSARGLFGADPSEIVLMSLPIIFGANIGTCATAFLASIKTTAEARRVATAHLLIKVLGVLVFFPFMGWFAEAVVSLSGAVLGDEVSFARLLANAHTLFNILLVLVLLPFTPLIAKLSRLITPDRSEQDETDDQSITASPELALSWAEQKTAEMFGLVGKMLANSIEVLRNNDRRLMEDTRKMDSRVDSINRSTVTLLTRLGQNNLSAEQSSREIRLINISNHLENTADIINREILFLAEKVMVKDLSFSFEGFHEIQNIHACVRRNLENARLAFVKKESNRLDYILANQERVGSLAAASAASHIKRLHKQIADAYSTEEVHFHLLSSLESVNRRITEAAREMRGIL